MIEKSSYIKSLLKIFAKTPFDALNYKQVASRMGAFDKGSRKMIADSILTLAEEKILIESGYISTSFGNRVLRTETASLYALSIINYILMKLLISLLNLLK